MQARSALSTDNLFFTYHFMSVYEPPTLLKDEKVYEEQFYGTLWL